MKNKSFRLNESKIPFLKKIAFLLFILTIPAAFAFGNTTMVDAEDAQELIKKAEKLQRKGKPAEAEKVLRQAVAQYPDDSPAKLALADILLKRRSLIEAFNLAYPVAEAEPKNSSAFAILGTVYLNAGNFKEAETLLINSVGLNRREALGWASLGRLDFYENRISESLNKLEAAVKYDRDEPDFTYELAKVYARAEKYKQAADTYREFLRISPSTDAERRERIKGLISFLRFLGGRTSLYDVSGNNKITVPVKLMNDRPIIELYINGKDKPLRFVLDTGSGISVLSETAAERIKIKPVSRGGQARALGGDGKFEIVYGFLNSVKIGDAKIKNVPIYIREFHNKQDNIDGYIGLSLISKFLTTIDYGNLTFTLDRTNKVINRETEKTVKFPLRLTSSGFLSGEVLLEGVESSLNFIVDTGATISVISDEVAAMENIKTFENQEKLRVIGAAGITENVSSFMLPKITFGIYSREKIKAIALDLDIINEASGYTQSGILGGNFLKNYSLTFDFGRSEVIFTPNEK